MATQGARSAIGKHSAENARAARPKGMIVGILSNENNWIARPMKADMVLWPTTREYELWFVSQGTCPALVLFCHLPPLQCSVHTPVGTSVFQQKLQILKTGSPDWPKNIEQAASLFF
jgi:hypothetical protein